VANYREISELVPSLMHTVKRHVIVNRVKSIHEFPVTRLENARGVYEKSYEKRKTAFE
jgi:hypothetical protein